MDRHDPFETMERMFEQMRMNMMGASGVGERRPEPGDGETGLQPMGGMGDTAGMGMSNMMPAMGGMGDTSAMGGTGGNWNITVEPTDEGYVAVADLPGFEREDITVRFEDGMLTISAVHEADEDSENASLRSSRRVRRSLRVPQDAGVVTEDVSATYHNGVLEITLPTDEPADDEHVIDIE